MNRVAMMTTKLELLIRKNTLMDMELWIQQEYLEIAKQMAEIEASGE